MQGRASDALAAVFSRAIAALRAAAATLMIFFVAAWWSWYSARPLALAAVAVAAAWALIFITTCLTRGVTTWLAAVNVFVAAAFGLSSRYCLPPDSVGDGGNWVFLANLNAGVVAGWVFPRAWYVAAITLLACAHYGGAYSALPQVASATVIIVSASTLFRVAASRLQGVAARADEQLRVAAARQHSDAIAAERARDRRERDRLIHDTVLNTLTGIGWGGGHDIDLVRRRCDRSILAVESLLTTEKRTTTTTTGNLVEQLQAAVDAAREGGLHIQARFPGQHDNPNPGGSGQRRSGGQHRRNERRHRARRPGGPSTVPRTSAGPTWRRGEDVTATDHLRPDVVTTFVRAAGTLLTNAKSLTNVQLRSGTMPSETSARPRRRRDKRDEDVGTANLPPDVVTAFVRATSESLTNVRLHSGTDHAQVEVTTAGGTVEVAIRDDGVGFDVASHDPRRLGLRSSVEGRMADVGGWVTIDAERGRGTTVRLSWRRAGGVDGVGAGPPRPAATATTTATTTTTAAAATTVAARAASELRRASDAAIRRVVGVLAAIWQALLLIALIASLDKVRSPAVAVVTWVATSVGIVVAGWVTRRRPLRRIEAATLLMIILAAIPAGTLNAYGVDVVRYPNWPIVVAHTALVIIIASRPMREWVPAGMVASAMMLGLPIAIAGTDPLVLTRAGTCAYIMWTSAIIFATLGPVWSSGAEATARAAEAEATLGARQEAAVAIRRDRARGLYLIERDLVPLLRSITNVELDPQDPAVRERCAHQAATLRRRLQQGATAPSSLGTIEQALEAAEERGVAVEVQVAGDFWRIPAGLREEIADWVRGALDGLRGGRATLTALCRDGAGSVVLSFPAPTESHLTRQSVTMTTPAVIDSAWDVGVVPAAVSPPPHLDVRTDVEEGRAFLEMKWETSAALA